jgi:hypothetical protein
MQESSSKVSDVLTAVPHQEKLKEGAQLAAKRLVVLSRRMMSFVSLLAKRWRKRDLSDSLE